MKIANTIVRKLAYMGKWGASHTSFDNLSKEFPGHLRGDVKKDAEKLIKENILLVKPTSYGKEVSLNPERKADIERMIKEIED